jgi:hypothetical protein
MQQAYPHGQMKSLIQVKSRPFSQQSYENLIQINKSRPSKSKMPTNARINTAHFRHYRHWGIWNRFSDRPAKKMSWKEKKEEGSLLRLEVSDADIREAMKEIPGILLKGSHKIQRFG